MRPIKYARDFLTGRRALIKDNVGGSGMYLIEKMPAIKSRKARTFFHHSIICCVTDAFEYFLNIDSTDNVFYKNIDKMNNAAGERFIKWETIYHTLFFTHEIRGSENVSEFESALFAIFDMDEAEIERYCGFKKLLDENEAEFITYFSNQAAKDIFKIDEINSIDTSFIYNFYYNCYTEFYRSYSKYSLIEIGENSVANGLIKVRGSGEVCFEAGQTGS